LEGIGAVSAMAAEEALGPAAASDPVMASAPEVALGRALAAAVEAAAVGARKTTGPEGRGLPSEEAEVVAAAGVVVEVGEVPLPLHSQPKKKLARKTISRLRRPPRLRPSRQRPNLPRSSLR